MERAPVCAAGAFPYLGKGPLEHLLDRAARQTAEAGVKVAAAGGGGGR